MRHFYQHHAADVGHDMDVAANMQTVCVEDNLKPLMYGCEYTNQKMMESQEDTTAIQV